MEWTRTYDLESDTAVILSSPSNGHPHPEAATSHAAGRRPDTTTWAESPSAKTDEIRQWCHIAMWEGFRRATPVSPQNVITAPWVRLKCRFGCALYGKDLQCPPHGLSSHETREMLDSYTSALLLEGAPPGRAFHDRLLRLEKKAFLAGFYKAFVFGAGPCPLCASCAEDGICRHPEQARPAMEGSGIDVYATARRAGIFLEPVTEKDQYVKYIGLLLLE